MNNGANNRVNNNVSPSARGAYMRGAIGALRYRLTGHRMPLALTARVTWRCDALCAACGMPNTARPELTTTEWEELRSQNVISNKNRYF